ncbi:unnamed protein product [Cochlearia groenlandica]
MERTTTVVEKVGSSSRRRRLVFDRRYGWVVEEEEWKEPSEEALSGGRGMFCVIPLSKSLFHSASLSINSAVKFIDMKILHKSTNPN